MLIKRIQHKIILQRVLQHQQIGNADPVDAVFQICCLHVDSGGSADIKFHLFDHVQKGNDIVFF